VGDLCAALHETYDDVAPEVLARDVRALLVDLHEAETETMKVSKLLYCRFLNAIAYST